MHSSWYNLISENKRSAGRNGVQAQVHEKAGRQMRRNAMNPQFKKGVLELIVL